MFIPRRWTAQAGGLVSLIQRRAACVPGGMEHQGALTALLFLPVGAVAGLALLEEAARRHLRVAGRLRAGYLQLRGPDRLALLLLLVTATVHAALLPAHGDEPLTAALFLLFTLGCAAVSGLALLGHRAWRPAAAGLLAGSVAAYAAYLGAGLEDPDVVGVATKAVELAAVATLAVSSRTYPRRCAST